MRRWLEHPRWDVGYSADEIVLELVVPGSKFGAVEVRFDPDEAAAAGRALLDAARLGLTINPAGDPKIRDYGKRAPGVAGDGQ